MAKKASTPCVGLCDIDSRSQLCRGCRRSLAEIGRWGGMSETERLAVMDQLAKRGSVEAVGDGKKLVADLRADGAE